MHDVLRTTLINYLRCWDNRKTATSELFITTRCL